MTIAEQTVAPEADVEDSAAEEDESASNHARYEISSYGADYPVDGLVKRLTQNAIYIPSFQRGFVWRVPQASRFIESLLLGLPVPAIFLAKELDTGKLVVIDGQQRLKTLQFFYEGMIGGREFSLRGVTEELEGQTYKSLGSEDRRRLDDAILHAIVVRQESPEDGDSSVYMLFERLNTTSVPLSPQEIRASVYHGPFNDYLNRANTDENWRAIFGPKSPRQKDKEMLLRFFALYFEGDSYERPMKLFLNRFMVRNRQLDRYQAAELDSVLKPATKLLNGALGPAAFRPVRALNAAVTDALLVGVARRLHAATLSDRDGFKRAMQSVIEDEEFRNLYVENTTDPGKVGERIERVVGALQAVH